MATTPEIKTKISLDGLRQAATGLRGFAKTVSDTLGDARKRGGKVFEPLGKGLDTVERKVKTVSKELTKLGTVNAFRGLKLGAAGASLAVAGLSAKIAAISAAAIKASKDTAASITELSTDAQRIGASIKDVSILGFAAGRAGVDRGEIVNQISTLSKEFVTLRNNIWKAEDKYEEFLDLTIADIDLAERLKNKSGAKELLSGFREADLDARKNSITDINNRIASIDGSLNQIRATRPVYNNRDINGAYGGAARRELIKERLELLDAAEAFKNSQSTQGQALLELMDYGVDFDRAAQGGVEGLVAISDAFQRIENPAKKSRIAINLFGDTGAKMIPLLDGGRQAIEDYRREMERLGGVATQADAAATDKYTASVQDLQTAIGGVKLEIARNLLPYLTDMTVAMTNWSVKSRAEIARHATEAFLATRTFGEDVMSLFGGDTSGIQTKWLDTTIKKTVLLRDVWRDVKKQISLLWKGQDTDYDWLNKLRGAFLEVKKFAQDTWAVVSGGDAKNFEWLNTARDYVVAFAKRLSDAFEMLKGLFRGIGDVLKPVLDYFGTDIMTFGLFVGMTRMVGLLGALTTGAGLLLKTLGSVFALGGGALAAGRAVAGVGGAAGAATATAAGLTASLVGVGAAIATVAKGATILGGSLVAGFTLGQQAAKYFFADTMKGYAAVHDAQAALMRAQAQGHVNMLLNERGTDRSASFQKRYWGKEGVDIGWHGMTADERLVSGRQSMDQNIWGKSQYTGADAAERYKEDASIRAERDRRNKELGLDWSSQASAPAPKRVSVDLNVAGTTTTLEGDEVSVARLQRDLEIATRRF